MRVMSLSGSVMLLESTGLAWENTIILQTPGRKSAYTKAISLAKDDCGEFKDANNNNRNGYWVREGLTSLLPIYDELRDSMVILWVQHENRTIGKIRS